MPAPGNCFAQHRWGADYKSMLALADFAATDWKKIALKNPPTLAYTKVYDHCRE